MFVRGEHRIPDVRNAPFLDKPRHPSDERVRSTRLHRTLEGWEAQRGGKLQVAVRHLLKRHVIACPEGGLKRGRLRADTEDSDAKRDELAVDIAERAVLRRASPCSGNLIPVLAGKASVLRLAGHACPWVEEDHGWLRDPVSATSSPLALGIDKAGSDAPSNWSAAPSLAGTGSLRGRSYGLVTTDSWYARYRYPDTPIPRYPDIPIR